MPSETQYRVFKGAFDRLEEGLDAQNEMRFNVITRLLEENIFTLKDISSCIGYSSNTYLLIVYNRYV